MATADTADATNTVLDAVHGAVIVDDNFLETVLTAILAKGHVLLEDVPGTGKTLTAMCLADALGLGFNRLQFTPDLLPADVTGSHIYDEGEGRFEFRRGPVFSNVVLADEINRAPPKTQAALLEAMEEKQVSIEGETFDLPEPFFVIATQNPVEQQGTFELPEAQRDRFMVKTAMGYPDRGGELDLLDRRADRQTRHPSLEPVVDRDQVLELQHSTEEVLVEDDMRGYIVDLCRATRQHDALDVGVSPRGIQLMFEASRARALIMGRDFVAPEDVKRLARPVLAHRLVLTTEAAVRDTDKVEVIEDVLERVEVPAVDPAD